MGEIQIYRSRCFVNVCGVSSHHSSFTQLHVCPDPCHGSCSIRETIDNNSKNNTNSGDINKTLLLCLLYMDHFPLPTIM